MAPPDGLEPPSGKATDTLAWYAIVLRDPLRAAQCGSSLSVERAASGATTVPTIVGP